MRYVVDATFENGVLKLKAPLPLADGQRVRVKFHTGPSWAQRTYGMMGWTGDPKALEYLAESPDLHQAERLAAGDDPNTEPTTKGDHT
jgi:predicted DNA-binding antitoxin AbrB/MazE fold protein